MTRGLTVLLLAAMLAGCGSSGSSGAAPPNTAPTVTQAPSASPSPAAYAPTRAGVCRAFGAFYVAFMRYTAHEQARLVPIAEAVLATEIKADRHTSRRMFTDASNLAAWVGSSAFPTTGSPLSRQFTRMEADCP